LRQSERELGEKIKSLRHWRSPEGGVDAWESLARI
jgi:hypothetical protein